MKKISWFDRIFGWWRVPDRLPKSKAAAVFCHTYSAVEDLSRLTEMSAKSMEKATELIRFGKADYLILPVAYYGEKEEKKIRQKIAQKNGIELDKIIFLDGVEDTIDEVFSAVKLLVSRFLVLKPEFSFIIVADRNHMRRSLQIFHRFLPGVELYNVSSACSKYERPFHEKFIQPALITAKWIHIVGNILLYLRNLAKKTL